MLPIGAYYPDSFRHVHMGPDEAVKAFSDLKSKWLVPMHYGTFKFRLKTWTSLSAGSRNWRPPMA